MHKITDNSEGHWKVSGRHLINIVSGKGKNKINIRLQLDF